MNSSTSRPGQILSVAGLFLTLLTSHHAIAQATPDITGFRIESNRPVLDFKPIPSAVTYSIHAGPDLEAAMPISDGSFKEFTWTGSEAFGDGNRFFQLQAQSMPPDRLTVATLLNRLAYGPTPDELGRARLMGPDAWIEQQIAPEGIEEDLETPEPFSPGWRRVSLTGTGSASTLYIYLDGPGDVYIDGLRLVAGSSDDGTQPNLIRNGDFETALGSEWVRSPNVSTSARTTIRVRTGAVAFHLVDTTGGSTRENSLYQIITPSLSSSQTYTLSYWYYTTATDRTLTMRLSGRGIDSVERLDGRVRGIATHATDLLNGVGSIAQLRSWHLLRAVQSRRQLNEILRQFFENHFVTEYTKTRDYFDGIGYPNAVSGQPAAQAEFIENRKWQQALLNPNVTFLDLLRISAESPAMIVYLDTVSSRGDRRTDGSYRVANENYARELCELFCFGVDNGYDQQDIVQLSRVWTGWSVDLRAPGQEGNPFAPRSTVYKDPNVVTNRNALTNLVGTWSLWYRNTRHDPRVKYIFYDRNPNGTPITSSPKRVPKRFGSPWAGRPYGLALTGGGNGTNTINEGYSVLNHMANQPFTQEFIVVKLCRLLIHDDFHPGYDFTDAHSSPEEDLVKAAMLAWENPPGGGPKGQLRPVLRVLLGSDVFRSTLASQHKVRTPLEFAVATVRAFRTQAEDGSLTSDTDGNGLQTMLNRAGRMRLFDRSDPDGYPESGAAWISAGTLVERLRFVQAFALRPSLRPGDELDSRTSFDPVNLLRIKRPAALTDAAAAADYILDLLFPAEGTANLAPYRDLAIRFLNTADNGVSSSPYAALSVGSVAHDQRLRGMIAFLLTTPRFQEQ
jgi:uncharacterized protein (DUF1800 family)